MREKESKEVNKNLDKEKKKKNLKEGLVFALLFQKEKAKQRRRRSLVASALSVSCPNNLNEVPFFFSFFIF